MRRHEGLFNGDGTGAIFAGVGKQVFACDRGFGAARAASGSAGPNASSVVLAIPPGGPGVIQNPNGQPCPAGYGNAGGLLETCNKKCEGGPSAGPARSARTSCSSAADAAGPGHPVRFQASNASPEIE